MERVNPKTGQPWKYGEIGLDGRIFLAYRRKSRINKDGTYQMNWLSPESWKKRKEYYKQTVKETYSINIKLIHNEKLKRGCACCGYNASAYALDFDHIDASTKICDVARMATRNLDKIQKEIAKCQVLCANCHRIKTNDPPAFATLCLKHGKQLTGLAHYWSNEKR
jgi:hypothetical protein